MTKGVNAAELPDHWASALDRHGYDPHAARLVVELYEQGSSVRPQRQDVFRAFHLTRLENVRVVILGQDPYPSPNEAHGLAFSVPNPLPAPRSLGAIHRNLKKDPRVQRPKSGDLTPWASNGVLLLNTALTVVQGDPGSHARNWMEFTDAVLRAIVAERPHVAFLLWGTHAIKKAASVPIDEPPHKVIRSSHPAAWGKSRERRFRDTFPFSEANDFLTDHGIEPVPWGGLFSPDQ
jgi:uracil-DNA glycosylase